eukprot:m.1640618 g.1640618  ORF g.1640618 m.1640618 type:complete len:177 (+) comp43050_c0_seq1:251-781(+)
MSKRIQTDEKIETRVDPVADDKNVNGPDIAGMCEYTKHGYSDTTIDRNGSENPVQASLEERHRDNIDDGDANIVSSVRNQNYVEHVYSVTRVDMHNAANSSESSPVSARALKTLPDHRMIGKGKPAIPKTLEEDNMSTDGRTSTNTPVLTREDTFRLLSEFKEKPSLVSCVGAPVM